MSEWGKVADPLERDIQKKVRAYAEALGVHTRKFSSPSQCSVPDVLFFFPGPWLLAIEFKCRGKKATPAQMKEMGHIAERGFPVFVIDNITDGKALIDEHQKISNLMWAKKEFEDGV